LRFGTLKRSSDARHFGRAQEPLHFASAVAFYVPNRIAAVRTQAPGFRQIEHFAHKRQTAIGRSRLATQLVMQSLDIVASNRRERYRAEHRQDIEAEIDAIHTDRARCELSVGCPSGFDRGS